MSTTLHLAAHAANVLAVGGSITNPAPADPTSGSNGVTLLLSYAKWGALIACAIAAVVSGGLMGVGSLSNRPDQVDKGKRALVWSLGGVIVTAIAIPLVNTVFGSVN
jgi:FtsH-binding integral membrane protein